MNVQWVAELAKEVHSLSAEGLIGISVCFKEVHLTPEEFLKNFNEYNHKLRKCREYPSEIWAVVDGVRFLAILDESKFRRLLGGRGDA